MSSPDQQDVRRCLAGDRQAFDRLIKRHQQTVTSLIWRFCRDANTCEELVQEVFVEAYFSLPGFKNLGPFEHWLKSIASRVGYRYLKLKTKHKTVSIDNLDFADKTYDDPDPAEVAGIVDRLLDTLSPEERLVLTLLYFDGCGTEQIADRMGWTRAMVKMRAYRARKKLRKLCDKEEFVQVLEWIR